MNRDSMMISFYGRTDHLKAKYKPMFDEILALNNEQALMFHCTAGKDRTGIGAALVLSALGVEKSYILADYEATNIFWKDTREKMIQGMLKSGMSEIAAKNMLAANPAYIRFFFDAIDKKFGSMEQFLNTEMELTSVKRKILSEKFLTIK
jgi:protein-tyrosine phosphatase